jgi:hypothetical protein
MVIRWTFGIADVPGGEEHCRTVEAGRALQRRDCDCTGPQVHTGDVDVECPHGGKALLVLSGAVHDYALLLQLAVVPTSMHVFSQASQASRCST